MHYKVTRHFLITQREFLDRNCLVALNEAITFAGKLNQES